MSKPKPFFVLTPKCEPEYSWIVDPDTAFNKPPEWKINLIFNAEDAATAKLEQDIEAGFTEWKQQLKAESPNKQFKVAEPRYGFAEKNSKAIFRVKTKKNCQAKDRQGKMFDNTPPLLFNKYGEPILGEERMKYRAIGEGSIVQVKLRCCGYDHPIHGVGMTIQPQQIMFFNFVPYEKEDNLEGFAVEKREMPDTTPSNVENSFGGSTF